MPQLNLWLALGYAVAVLVEIGAPLLLAVALARRCEGKWKYWGYGVLVFLLFQGVTRIPAMVAVQSLPAFQQALKQPAVLWGFLLFAAFTAGLFEEGGRWLAIRFFVPAADRRWNTALMLGAGHGGLESIGVGLLVLVGLVNYLAIVLIPAENLGAPAAAVEQARQQFASMQGWEPLLGAWERVGALAVQLGLSVMVMQAFLRGQRWWWYALAAHTVVDFTSVGLLQVAAKPLGQSRAVLVVEGLVTVYALLAFWYIMAMRERGGTPSPRELAPNESQ